MRKCKYCKNAIFERLTFYTKNGYTWNDTYICKFGIVPYDCDKFEENKEDLWALKNKYYKVEDLGLKITNKIISFEYKNKLFNNNSILFCSKCNIDYAVIVEEDDILTIIPIKKVNNLKLKMNR